MKRLTLNSVLQVGTLHISRNGELIDTAPVGVSRAGVCIMGPAAVVSDQMEQVGEWKYPQFCDFVDDALGRGEVSGKFDGGVLGGAYTWEFIGLEDRSECLTVRQVIEYVQAHAKAGPDDGVSVDVAVWNKERSSLNDMIRIWDGRQFYDGRTLESAFERFKLEHGLDGSTEAAAESGIRAIAQQDSAPYVSEPGEVLF